MSDQMRKLAYQTKKRGKDWDYFFLKQKKNMQASSNNEFTCTDPLNTSRGFNIKKKILSRHLVANEDSGDNQNLQAIQSQLVEQW